MCPLYISLETAIFVVFKNGHAFERYSLEEWEKWRGGGLSLGIDNPRGCVFWAKVGEKCVCSKNWVTNKGTKYALEEYSDWAHFPILGIKYASSSLNSEGRNIRRWAPFASSAWLRNAVSRPRCTAHNTLRSAELRSIKLTARSFSLHYAPLTQLAGPIRTPLKPQPATAS